MSSSAPTSTGGTTTTVSAPGQPSQAGGVGSGADGSGPGSQASNGAEGNVVEKQQSGAGGGVPGHGGTEPNTSSPAHHGNGAGGGAVGGTANTTGTVLRRKTNVCLICGIYTNLSLNIFEPRNGPNIVDVIYEKYKFRAERGDNADKHICFSCNNWLINWYSLQNTSSGSSRTYEPAPSTSRSSSAADSSNNSRPGRHHHGHKPRTKPVREHRHAISRSSSNDKENCRDKPRSASENVPPHRLKQYGASNPDQHGQVSSTTSCPGEDRTRLSHAYRQAHPYSKNMSPLSSGPRRCALKEHNGPCGGVFNDVGQRRRQGNDLREAKAECVDVVSSSTDQDFDPHAMLVKPFESRLIQMLEGQGTSVTKEAVPDDVDQCGNRRDTAPWQPTRQVHGNSYWCRKRYDANGNCCSGEIVLSFDTALSEVMDVVPSLRAIHAWAEEDSGRESSDPVEPLRHRLSSGALSVSIIGDEGTRSSRYGNGP